MLGAGSILAGVFIGAGIGALSTTAMKEGEEISTGNVRSAGERLAYAVFDDSMSWDEKWSYAFDPGQMVADFVTGVVIGEILDGIMAATQNKLRSIFANYDATMREAIETSYGKSREIIQCNTKDAAADELAKRIGGQSRSAFADDPIQREFDVISDQYIAQAKPPLKCVNKTVRTQMKATFEAAKKYERKVYYQFEGIPSQEVLDKLYEYSERYGVEVIIDTEPLGILN